MTRRMFKNAALAALAVLALLPGLASGADSSPQDSLPLPARQALYKAYAAMNENKPAEAVAALTAFKNNPSNAKDLEAARSMVEFAEGNARYSNKDYSRALACFERSVRADPGHSAAWSNMAVLCHEMGDAQRAGRCFLKAYDAAGEKKSDLLYSAAAAFLMSGKHADSAAAFDRLFADFPRQATNQWREYAIHAYLEGGQSQKALAMAETLAAASKGAERRRWNEFLLHQSMALNMNKKALELAARLVEEEPGEPMWWKALANLHLVENRLEKGLMALWAYGKIAPWTREERKLAADLFLALDIPAQAAAMLELFPDNELTPAMIKQGVYCYRRLQQADNALALLNKHADRLKDKDLVILRADIYYESGQYADASVAYERAAAKGCSPGRAWLMAGYAALADGDKERANQAFQNAVRFESHATEAKNMLKRLS